MKWKLENISASVNTIVILKTTFLIADRILDHYVHNWTRKSCLVVLVRNLHNARFSKTLDKITKKTLATRLLLVY